MVRTIPSDSSEVLPDELAQAVQQLELVAHESVLGLAHGRHASRRRGSSIEFSEHGRYVPGENIRHIDWSVFARTDDLHVKRFNDEVDATLLIGLDASGSMGFGNKFTVAKQLAAALSYVALSQRDRCGLVCFGEPPPKIVVPRSSSRQRHRLFRVLAETQSVGSTAVSAALTQGLNKLSGRCLLICISDFFDHIVDIRAFCRFLVVRGVDLMAVQVLDPRELEFPYDEPCEFIGMEDERRIAVSPRQIRKAYLKEMSEFLKEVRLAVTEVGGRYYLADSSRPVASMVHELFRAHMHSLGR